MIFPQKIAKISDLRYKTADLLKSAKKTPVLIYKSRNLAGVLLSPQKFKEMLDMIEDYLLSLEAKEYEKKDKRKVRWLSHKKLEQLLKE